MAAHAIACASCSWPVPREFWNREEGTRCRGCQRHVSVSAFPAIDRTTVGASPEALVYETEASCFYHPQSRAAIPCAECGRFLCNLCDLEVEGRHICPGCFENESQRVEPRRLMYDTVALMISTLPALLFWPALAGAPWSLFIVFRRWNAPGSIVPRTKIRFILAAIFAVSEIGFVIFAIYVLMHVSLKPPVGQAPGLPGSSL